VISGPQALQSAQPSRTAGSDPDARTLLFEQVLEQCGEAVIVKDLDAIVTYWNREASALYGFSAAEAVGQPLRNLHAADLPESEYARILKRIRSGKSTAATTERRKRNGDNIRVAIRTTPLVDHRGRLVGEITIARDVTLLHRTEEALQGARAALEAKLAAMRESHRTLAHEVAARGKVERAQRRANQALSATVSELEAFHRDGEALSRMAELLQSCTHRDEAYAIVRETVRQMFPGIPGSLYIYRESRDVLEHAATWGDEHVTDPVLGPEDCWALRLGRPHFVHQHDSIRCRHAHQHASHYVCMPVQGQGQVLGLMHLGLDASRDAKRRGTIAERRFRALADRVGPALANLKLRDALRELALRDGLTGLYNRRYLEDALSRELHRSERSGKPVAVIMIDVDHFKRFNDTHGHDAGDFVLGTIAKQITRNVRPSDIACRYGGEELAVVLVEADLRCALERAEALRVAIAEASLVHRGQVLPGLTASFGVAVYPQHGRNVADFMKAADRALYKAKRLGRDRLCAAEDAAAEPAVV
jgi:diguanylate cyclase (GGDEF)-like protein/PAS domain S-box-containing protein